MNQVDEYKEGDKFQGRYGLLEILAVRGKYMMVKNKGCIPFVSAINDFPGRLVKQKPL